MAENPKLSSRERQLMDVVYRLGEATARDVEKALPDALANATVRTLLRILERKGYLRHRIEGRQFIYAARQSKEKARESAMKRLLGVFYDGSVTAAVSGMLQLEDARLGEQELADLEHMIREARRKGAGK